jgi:hypothetical protein
MQTNVTPECSAKSSQSANAACLPFSKASKSSGTTWIKYFYKFLNSISKKIK